MAIAEFVAKMVLDTKEWSTDLNTAKKQIRDFQQSTKNASDFVNNLGGSLLSSATKFAGWAGAGLAAKEGLEKFMRAGQTTGDFLDRETAKWTGLFDEFFKSLNHGDISGFVQIMGRVRDAIDEAHRAADSFADAEASSQVLKSSFELQQKKLLQEIKRNKNNPELVAENQKALKELETNYRRQLGALALLKEDVLNADINALISAPMSGGLKSVGGKFATNFLLNRSQKTSIQSIQKILEFEALDLYPSIIASAKAIAEDLKSKKGPRGLSKEFQASAIDAINSFSEKYGLSFLDLLKWDELDEEGRKQIRSGVKSYFDILRTEFEFNERNTEIFNIGKTAGAVGKGVTSTAKSFMAGQLGYYDQEIAKKRKEMQEATDAVAIAKIQAEIKKLEFARDALLSTASLAEIKAGKLKGGSVLGAVTKISAKDAKMPENAILPELPDYAEAINGLSSLGQMMKSFSMLTNEGASAWLNWAGNALESLRSVFVAFQSTTMAGAASGAASSGPFGWLTIPIAIASALASFSAIPKFAQGGIVGGGSYSGDKVLAGLNSGEMVLNSAQQAKLWNQINNGGAVGAVEFKIRGSELVGVINNYNGRRSHVI